MKPLDTSVKGSPGTLGASADFLDKYAKALDSTAYDLTEVNKTRESSWKGPASEACGDALDNIDTGDVDSLASNVRKVSQAERDFEHDLNAVQNIMNHATYTAQGGGLQINGPFIMPPAPPGAAPDPPKGPVKSDHAKTADQKYKKDMAAHHAACADYNEKSGFTSKLRVTSTTLATRNSRLIRKWTSLSPRQAEILTRCGRSANSQSLGRRAT